jgi:hypothetical protein
MAASMDSGSILNRAYREIGLSDSGEWKSSETERVSPAYSSKEYATGVALKILLALGKSPEEANKLLSEAPGGIRVVPADNEQYRVVIAPAFIENLERLREQTILQKFSENAKLNITWT